MTDNLREIALESLRANIVHLPSGKFLTAGQHQFQTLWTRDFCHAVRGLLLAGEDEVAENHLARLLSNLREDGLVPRVLDNYPVQLRVAWQTFRTLVPKAPGLEFREPLTPRYIDEHGSNAYDSNVLLLLAALRMPLDFWRMHEVGLRRVWGWYEDKFRDGLIHQPPFSDWQDTTKREGKTYLLNLLLFLVATRLKGRGWEITLDLGAYRQRIFDAFLSDNLFRSLEGSDVISIEGNLMALEAQEFLNAEEKRRLWSALNQHPLVTLDGAIGRCSYPDWPSVELAWHIRFANLERYHGSLSWSWIAGLGLKVAQVMGDEDFTLRQQAHLQRLLTRDRSVVEIYDPAEDFRPWRSWLLKAERPFAWGAAYVLDALTPGPKN
jgi:hypothetical protein